MRITITLLIFIFSTLSIAETAPRTTTYRIQVNAILNNAAVITINGQQQMLRKNSRSTEGYKLTDIGVDKITLLISGEYLDFKLGAAITSSKSSASGKPIISISRDSRGMFLTEGQINGYPVKLLVDTGATFVAINSTLAKKIGIDYLRHGKPHNANTASGVVIAHKLVLNNLSIGNLKLYLVDAVVIEGDFPVTPLLGMSFLKRVKLKDEGMLLTIEEKL